MSKNKIKVAQLSNLNENVHIKDGLRDMIFVMAGILQHIGTSNIQPNYVTFLI